VADLTFIPSFGAHLTSNQQTACAHTKIFIPLLRQIDSRDGGPPGSPVFSSQPGGRGATDSNPDQLWTLARRRELVTWPKLAPSDSPSLASTRRDRLGDCSLGGWFWIVPAVGWRLGGLSWTTADYPMPPSIFSSPHNITYSTYRKTRSKLWRCGFLRR